MPTHMISVTVEDNAISVQPETLSMTMVDEVKWGATNGRAFTIEFDDDRMLGRRALEHAAATTLQKARQRGRFKYTVVSASNPKLRLDPVIIVDDPPTGP